MERGRSTRRSNVRLLFLVAAWLSSASALGRAGNPEAPSPRVELLPAGITIADVAPAGWSWLVIKSIPRLETGEIDTLPSMALNTATLFRTVILADIRQVRVHANARPTYQLQRLGLGLCTPFKGADVVVTATDATPARDALGFLERQVLDRAEEELLKGRLIASTATLALYAAPGHQRIDGEQVKIWIVYAFLIDPDRGTLTTVVWSIPEQGKARSEPSALHVLAPNLIWQCGLDVAAQRLLGTVPLSWNFAMCALPPGRKVAVPPSLRETLRRPRAMTENPAAFERTLRSTLNAPAPAQPTRPPAQASR
ncbi:MAG: hypothetical protein U0794_11125 [Isosphaeraceae bacterium]